MESAENRDKSSKVNPIEESKDSPTLSKIETIKLLNDSIDQLESTIKDLSQNSTVNLPSPDSINTLLNTTQELADSVSSPPAPPPATPVTEIPPENTTPIASPTVLAPIEPVAQDPPPVKETEVKPKNIEAKNKSVTKNKKQENRSLRIISIVAVAIGAIALIWLWLPQGNTTTVSSLPEPTTTEIVNPPETNDINLEPQVTTPPIADPQINSDRLLEDNITVENEPEIDSPEVIFIPPALEAPGRAKNLKIDTIEPELTFTPEQTLIAALQDKLAELTSSYDSDLFDSVEVDLPSNRLLIEVTDNWYELDESSQDKLANKILKRSRQLDFSKLQLQDSTGTLVARNPVIGDRAIIVQTSKNN